jgi:hypothetical protein
MGGTCGNVWGTEEMHTEFWWETLKDTDHLEDLGVDGSLILKLNFQK